jgi:hypothetical protein
MTPCSGDQRAEAGLKSLRYTKISPVEIAAAALSGTHEL